MKLRLAIMLVLLFAGTCFALTSSRRMMVVIPPIVSDGNGVATLTGQGGGGGVGSLSVTGNGLVNGEADLTGQGSGGGIGSLTIDSQVFGAATLSGQGGGGGIGSLSVSGNGSTSVNISGQGGSGGYGSLSIEGQILGAADLTGQGSAGALGTVSAEGQAVATASLTGQGGGGGQGTISASGQQFGAASITGQGGAGAQGTIGADAQALAAVSITGQGGAGGIPSSLSTLQSSVMFAEGQGGGGGQGAVTAEGGSIGSGLADITGQGGAGGQGTITVAALHMGAASITGQGGAGGQGTITVAGLHMGAASITGQGGAGAQGTVTAASAGGGPVTEDCATGATKTSCQNFETATTGYDNGPETWTESSSGTCTYAPASSANNLRGTQSLRITDASMSDCALYKAVTASGTESVLFRINIADISAALPALVALGDGTTRLVYIDVAGDRWVYFRMPGVAQVDANYQLTVGTTYYGRMDYVKGTGADAVGHLYLSTTTTMPGTPQATITNSSATADVNRVTVYLGGTATVDFDQIMTSASTMGDPTP